VRLDGVPQRGAARLADVQEMDHEARLALAGNGGGCEPSVRQGTTM
jgi:hypothetical protein